MVVPVHPAYNSAVLHYLEFDGEIWNGGEVPTVDDPLYISIVDELKQADANTAELPVGGPWQIKVPTALVMLQPDSPAKLPDFTNTLMVQFQSRAPGTADLTMSVKNVGGTSALNVTVTSIQAIDSAGSVFVHKSGLLDPPFIVPGGANLLPGTNSKTFNLNFAASTGSLGSPFSFVITLKADGTVELPSIIAVP